MQLLQLVAIKSGAAGPVSYPTVYRRLWCDDLTHTCQSFLLPDWTDAVQRRTHKNTHTQMHMCIYIWTVYSISWRSV